MAKKNKRKTSFLRKLYEKLNPSAPTEPDDPGEDVSVIEENADPDKKAEEEQQEKDPSAVNSVIFALCFLFRFHHLL